MQLPVDAAFLASQVARRKLHICDSYVTNLAVAFRCKIQE